MSNPRPLRAPRSSTSTGRPWKCFAQPLRLTDEAALRTTLNYHIVGGATLAGRDLEWVEKVRADSPLRSFDTGHDRTITHPQAVADALLQIAAA